MPRLLRSLALGLGASLAVLQPILLFGESESGSLPIRFDVSDHVTVDRAITTAIKKAEATQAGTGYLGIAVSADGAKTIVTDVQPTSPAARAGLKEGDVLLHIDKKGVATAAELRDLLQSKGPGASVLLRVQREDRTLDLAVTLTSTSRPKTAPTGGATGPGTGKGGGKGGKGADALPFWTSDKYRLAVIVIEFADQKANEMIAAKTWDEAFFSRLRYNEKNATGQPVFGSLHDYFREQSYGKFRLEGKVFEPVTVSKKRGDYAQGSGTANKTVPLVEALEKLATRDGKEALQDFDGLAFIYAGARVNTNRGNLYYPHRGSLTHQGKRWQYILGPEGGTTMEHIGIFSAEFGKLLGLPELAARTENPGSEGLGVWCLMSDGAGKNGKPSHLGAWCKEQLGWIKPAVIDPTMKQKLLLSPVLKSPKEFLKVLVRHDGSEYFLLENRQAHGFDADLPGQGLLVWRVVNNRPILEESHGVTGPAGPKVQLDLVPFPSKANRAFTPTTTPSSQSLTGGGFPVHLTNIQRLPDGRIALLVGFEFN